MAFKLVVNRKEFTSSEKIINGNEILTLAGFLPVEGFDLYKKIKDNEYEPIQPSEKVDLGEPGIESFKVIPRKQLQYSLDDEIYSTDEVVLTPVEILKIHGYTPDQYYLKQIVKHIEITYKTDLDKLIDMVEEPKFITCKNEPTKVSFPDMAIGITELKRQLEVLGYKAELINDQFVCFKFKIPLGRFRDKEIEIALEAPQFPLNPPSGPYIKPHLMPITGGGGLHPEGAIHQMNKPSSEFQYWSRPFNNWNNTAKNAKIYLAFIRTLMDFQ